jgi:hypothetical protein
MGYRCPVCESPQPDAEHLANHLAFTGLMGEEDHEGWLDDHVPDWADRDPTSLGEALADLVPTVDLDGNASDGHEHHDHPSVETVSTLNQEVDPVTRAALEEAREMTREMQPESASDEGSGSSAVSTDSDDGDGAEGEDR